METIFEAATLLGSLPLAFWFGRICLDALFELMPARDRANRHFASKARRLREAFHHLRLFRVWSLGLRH